MIVFYQNTNSGQGTWIGKDSFVKAQTSEGAKTFEGVVVADPVSFDDASNGRGPSSYIVHDFEVDQDRIVMPDKIRPLKSDEVALFKSKYVDKYAQFKNSKLKTTSFVSHLISQPERS